MWQPSTFSVLGFVLRSHPYIFPVLTKTWRWPRVSDRPLKGAKGKLE